MPRDRHDTLSASTFPLTVTQMAERLGLSRRRFYELIGAKKFPPPVYLVATRRPIYPDFLQAECLRIKATGLALDGTVIVFNMPRAEANRSSAGRRSGRASEIHQKHSGLIEYLSSLGIDASADKVDAAIRDEFPDGVQDVNDPVLWRAVVRRLRAR